MQLSDFSSLFEVSVAFIAVSAVVGDLEERAVSAIDKGLDALYTLKGELALDETVSDYIDAELSTLEAQIEPIKVNLGKKMRAMKLLTWGGIGVPLIALYIGAYGAADVGYGFANVLLAISFAWGPATIFAAKKIISFEVSKLIEPLSKLISAAISNKVDR
jgi:hypothetical protein